jgi:hypothetical protein
MASTKISINGQNIHQGEGFLIINPLRPAPYLPLINDGNIPPTITDPSYGTWVANKGTWQASTGYVVGNVIVDQNGNVEICTTAGTSAVTEPTWPTVSLGTVTDGTTLVWTMLGRVGTSGVTGSSGNWVASFAYLVDDEVRDSNGNVQICIVAGTSAAAAPTWGTAVGAITTDGGVTWFNLGPTLSGGATEGVMTCDIEGKVEAISADQETLPLASVLTAESASIAAEFKELSLQLVSYGIPHASYKSAFSLTALPAGAQSFSSLSTGGLVALPNLVIGVLSPRRLYTTPGAARFNTFILQKCYAKGAKPGLGFSRTKTSMWKAEWDALAVETFPLGLRGAALIQQ